MFKTVLGNDYDFDADNYDAILILFEEEITELIEDAVCPIEIICGNLELILRVSTACLFCRLFLNEHVPFEDEEWLTQYFSDIEKRIYAKVQFMVVKHYQFVSTAKCVVTYL